MVTISAQGLFVEALLKKNKTARKNPKETRGSKGNAVRNKERSKV